MQFPEGLENTPFKFGLDLETCRDYFVLPLKML